MIITQSSKTFLQNAGIVATFATTTERICMDDLPINQISLTGVVPPYTPATVPVPQGDNGSTA